MGYYQIDACAVHSQRSGRPLFSRFISVEGTEVEARDCFDVLCGSNALVGELHAPGEGCVERFDRLAEWAAQLTVENWSEHLKNLAGLVVGKDVEGLSEQAQTNLTY